jgi:hypothetical protein
MIVDSVSLELMAKPKLFDVLVEVYYAFRFQVLPPFLLRMIILSDLVSSKSSFSKEP